jgi:hypothetical protein
MCQPFDKAALDGLVDYLGAAVTITPRGLQVVREDVLAELSQAPVPDDDVTMTFLLIGASIGTVGTRLRSPRVSADTLDDEARRGTLKARAEAPRKVFKHRRRAQWVVQPPAVRAVAPTANRSPDLVGWYCGEDSCLVLGADGWSRTCEVVVESSEDAYERPSRRTSCTTGGAWSSVDGGVLVGATRWVWQDGVLVRGAP